MPEQTDRTGWYEFISADKATTHIAYVYEDGSIYFPEGPTVVGEDDDNIGPNGSKQTGLAKSGLKHAFHEETNSTFNRRESGNVIGYETNDPDLNAIHFFHHIGTCPFPFHQSGGLELIEITQYQRSG